LKKWKKRNFETRMEKSVAYFSAFDADDSVQGSCRVVEKWDVDGGRRGRDPRTFRLRVDVEHVSLARENWLFPNGQQKKRLS
jgi:hypothetical protein